MCEMTEDSGLLMVKLGCLEQWVEETDFTPLHIEEMLFSQEFGYAGTTDVIADIHVAGTEVLAVGDWKTATTEGSGANEYPRIYDTHALQVAAYGHALVEMGHSPSMPYGFVTAFAKKPCANPFRTKIWTPEEMNENLRVFLCLLQVWNWQHALDQKKPKRARKATA